MATPRNTGGSSAPANNVKFPFQREVLDSGARKRKNYAGTVKRGGFLPEPGGDAGALKTGQFSAEAQRAGDGSEAGGGAM